MIDTDSIRARVDIVQVASRYTELKKSGRRLRGLCPLHNERTPSFFVDPERQCFKCFGCNAGGDVIKLIQLRENVSFHEACSLLGGDGVALSSAVQPGHSNLRRYSDEEHDGPPSLEWQAAVWEIVIGAERTLWSNTGTLARRYLMETRGLSERVIREARLGYVPGQPLEWKKINGLNVPCGITIPWIIDGDVWMVKVRKSDPKMKYRQIGGGSSRGLYRVDQVLDFHEVLIVEGEFDALVVAEASRMVAAVALGSASNTLRKRWMPRLLFSRYLYARLDDDSAGHGGVARLAEVSQRVRAVQVPEPHKDINDFWIEDRDGLRAWLSGLAAHFK